jgi:tRNA 2-thiouridine synthesizing protein A
MIHEIDAIGLLCPLPVLKARKALNAAASGDEVHILANDPVAVIDIPHFCHQSGHHFIESRPREDGATLYILRAK